MGVDTKVSHWQWITCGFFIMKIKIISFYSDIEGTTYYSDHAKRLKQECESLSIPHDIREKESLGSYQANCLSKPAYILERLEEYNEPLVWMDIDSRIHKTLDIFDTFDESVDVVFATANGEISGMKASPLYFGNTSEAKRFIETWIHLGKDILENNKGVFDHEPLFALIPAFANNMNIKFVGPDYCVWPGHTNENTYITMGLADVESKKESLRKLGMDEEMIEWQSTGDKI